MSMRVRPYAEDYANALRDPSTPTADFHRRTYGDMPYQGFREIFEHEPADFDAGAWAEQFRAAGAVPVVRRRGVPQRPAAAQRRPGRRRSAQRWQVVADLVAAGQVGGELAPGDPVVAALLIGGAVDGLVGQAVADPAFDLATASTKLERLLRRALTPAATPTR